MEDKNAKIEPMKPQETNKDEGSEGPMHPIHRQNYVAGLFYLWLQPTISLGYKRPLQMDDIDELSTKWKSKALYDDFVPYWDDQVKTGSPSLLKALFHRFKWQYFESSTYLVFYTACAVTLPLTVRGLLQFVNAPDEYLSNPYWGLESGYYLVVLMGLFSAIQTIALNKGFSTVSVMGCKLRSTVMTAIYKKSLRLSPAAKRSESSAENLMSSDAERIFISLLTSNIVYIGMMLIVAVAVLLVLEIGVSGFIGVAFTFIIAPIQGRMAKQIGQMKRAMLKHTDKRVKFTGEVLNGINVVKISAWETQLIERINAMRGDEMKLDKKILYYMATNAWLLFVVPSIISVVVFAIYVSLGNALTVETVFTVLVYLGIIRIPIAVLPRAVSDIAQAFVSLKRIETFLCLPELEESKPRGDATPEEGIVVKMKDATFQWVSLAKENQEEKQSLNKSSRFPSFRFMSNRHNDVTAPAEAMDLTPKASVVLRDISFEMQKGEMIGVVGKVGSGKSSLVSAVLEEIDYVKGDVYLNTGAIAYVAQEPWIQNATLRNNILFRSSLFTDSQVELPTDKNLLRIAIQASQLVDDAKVLPNGLETEIGDRGVNLSGGQKSRVTIARAIYRALRYDLDVAVFDDPFSALDPHVGQVVFEQVLLKHLKSKTRLVVLNSHLHLLEKMDRIAVMDDGKMVAFDTPDNVLNDARFAWLGQSAEEARKAEKEDEKAKTKKGENNEALELDEVDLIEERITSSVISTGSEVVQPKYKDDDEGEGLLYKKEDRQLGAVERHNYVRWVGAGVGFGATKYFVIVGILSMFIISQGLKIGTEYFLGYWSENQESMTFTQAMGVYGAFVIGLCTFQLAGTLGFMKVAISSALNLHNQLTHSVLRAPLNLFFDVTPAGRILNRFSTDLDKVDQRLPETLLQFTRNIFQVLATVVICVFSSPYFLAILIPLFIIFGFIVVYFARTSREVKRLEGISRSPLFSNFGESLQGLSTIRSFKMQSYFHAKSDYLVDSNSKVFLVFWLAARWLALRVDLLATCIQVAVGCFSVYFVGVIPAELVGLALLYSLQMMGLLQYTVRLSIETENYMTSVERLLAYGADKIPQEEPVRKNPEIKNSPLTVTNNLEDKLVVGDKGELELSPAAASKLEASWPSQGEIVIHDVSMRYRPHLPLVLKNVSLTIAAKSRVAVVGRTGSGKSSFMSLFFRLIDPPESGFILIDGTPISSVPLPMLRSKLAIIPQAPTLFSGTVRFNIDPWAASTDAEIWQALERVQLANAFRSTNGDGLGLDSVINENGSNLSVGQRQLMCIARALLKQAKVVLMDEATANVDRATDRVIQEAMQNNFNHTTTTLVIAHRINTIIDADKIAVLEYGVLKEYDTPYNLVKEGGIFASMVETSGLTSQVLNSQ